MAKNVKETMSFQTAQLRRDEIRRVLDHTKTALEEKGYNAVNQMAGYLISNDPAYISSHNNARSVIQTVERYEIIEELVRYYLNEK